MTKLMKQEYMYDSNTILNIILHFLEPIVKLAHTHNAIWKLWNEERLKTCLATSHYNMYVYNSQSFVKQTVYYVQFKKGWRLFVFSFWSGGMKQRFLFKDLKVNLPEIPNPFCLRMKSISWKQENYIFKLMIAISLWSCFCLHSRLLGGAAYSHRVSVRTSL